MLVFKVWDLPRTSSHRRDGKSPGEYGVESRGHEIERAVQTAVLVGRGSPVGCSQNFRQGRFLSILGWNAVARKEGGRVDSKGAPSDEGPRS